MGRPHNRAAFAACHGSSQAPRNIARHGATPLTSTRRSFSNTPATYKKKAGADKKDRHARNDPSASAASSGGGNSSGGGPEDTDGKHHPTATPAEALNLDA